MDMAKERWEIDRAHSGIHFSVRHMVIAKVRGEFARWSADILTDPDDPGGASVEAVIDTTSIATGATERDTHLKSADFLDVVQYPEITFRSTRVQELGGDVLRVGGNLTIRGVTKEVLLDVQDNGRIRDPWGHERAGFSAKTSIDRKAFGLNWNQLLETGGLMVGDRVEIEIEVEATKAPGA
jgi:polyisoprenoid-binding protein YceI